jgi:hypothetical protein
MADGLKDIIASLEQQRVAIEKALEALKEADGSVTSAAPAQPPAKRRGRKPGPQARKAASAAKTAPATRKGRISEEGRQKLALAMKRRWAAKRAGAKVTKATAKNAVKKAAKKKAAA